MPNVDHRNAISVGFLALNADAVATGSRGAQNGLVIRSEDQSVGGSVSEVLSECSCLVNVVDATVSGVTDSLVVEASKEARSNKGIEDVVSRGESALGGKERGEERDCREHFWMSVVRRGLSDDTRVYQ